MSAAAAVVAAATTTNHAPHIEPPPPLQEMVQDDDHDSDTEEASSSNASSANLESNSPPHPSLREISPLASWTVSTYKPGCGVPALLSPSPLSFWQSDGPQPHLLNIHFFKLVCIVKMRVYLDFELDESYTPTKMVFAAGMGEYDLTEFAEWAGKGPKGWVEVGLGGVGGRMAGAESGGGDDGAEEGDGDKGEGGERGGGGRGRGADVLRCMCVQVRVVENHQNGKDTHVRGVQIFARDERVGRGEGERRRLEEGGMRKQKIGKVDEGEGAEEIVGLQEADWMGEPELR